MEVQIDARRVHRIVCEECGFEAEHTEGDMVEWGEVGNDLDEHRGNCIPEAVLERIDGVIEFWGITIIDHGFGKCEDDIVEIGEFIHFSTVERSGPFRKKYWAGGVYQVHDDLR